jgi:hypothetical protein
LDSITDFASHGSYPPKPMNQECLSSCNLTRDWSCGELNESSWILTRAKIRAGLLISVQVVSITALQVYQISAVVKARPTMVNSGGRQTPVR